jgi:hypothetical protein
VFEVLLGFCFVSTSYALFVIIGECLLVVSMGCSCSIYTGGYKVFIIQEAYEDAGGSIIPTGGSY